MNEPKAKPTRDVGPYRKLTAAEIVALAKVTPDDIEAAKAWWRKRAPRKYRALLDAVEIMPREKRK